MPRTGPDPARILIFAKAPVPGQAKTRLIPALGTAGAAALAERLLRATVARMAAARLAPVDLWCAPDTSHPVFAELAATYDLALHRQQGVDLGERLLNATAVTLNQAAGAVLIGTDCPQLDAGCLRRALAGLADHDAVLGPAADGGYVLLALRAAAPALFAEMPWGGARVAALTRARMAQLGWRWQELPVLQDLDRPADLVRLAALAR
ncbi:MAG: glycosyltransferase [Chromatiaceae bacterium]|nr:MAG: glycosyltransferase [Chromatiaceae bacterium]